MRVFFGRRQVSIRTFFHRVCHLVNLRDAEHKARRQVFADSYVDRAPRALYGLWWPLLFWWLVLRLLVFALPSEGRRRA